MPDANRVLVYSTDGSLPLPGKERKKPLKSSTSHVPPNDGIVRVGCERRRGGLMTLIHGLLATEIVSFAKELKRRCGTGGTTKGDIIELQGDHRDTVLDYLQEQKRRGKRMGG